MFWNEIVITTTEEASEAVSEMLSTIGAEGVVIEDPHDIRAEIMKPNTLDYADEEFMNSLGEDVVIKAYFSETNKKDEIIALIKQKLNFISKFLDIGKATIESDSICEEDWSTSWKKYYKPIKISENVVIKPSWEEYNAMPEEVVIEMDPGMAFGTGTHETTRLCSRYLEKYMKHDYKVADVGTGTGILSIISAKLGAKSVTAVDLDETAVKVAVENCKNNIAEDKVNIFAGTIDDIKERGFDIVVANIIANVIIEFAPRLSQYLKKDGIFIASGIIHERKAEVIESLEKNNFKLIEVQEDGEWVAMVFKNA